ncbi:MAG: hypothetical protein AAF561_11680 [Planctomycetota bacterium]
MTYQRTTFIASAAAAACLLSATPSDAGVFTTSFDSPTYSANTINGQDGWIAQLQWRADGAGNITNVATNDPPTNAGAFVRAHNLNVLGSTAVGETMTITSSFTLGDYADPSTDIGTFEEGIFQQGLSHQQGVANFGYGLAAGLFYSANKPDKNVELRAAVGTVTSGTTALVIGEASTLGGTSYTLVTSFTKVADDSWSVTATLSDGVNPPSSISYVASAGVDLNTDSDGGGILGGIQGLPSGGGSAGVATPPFGSTTVSDFTIEVIPVPEPVAAMAGVAALGLIGLRRSSRRIV